MSTTTTSTQPPSRSPQLRHDKANNRWVIFSPARSKRPTDLKSKSPTTTNASSSSSSSCPFCLGHEHECAPEIFRVPPGPEWKIRVIENLYPALDRRRRLIGERDGDCWGDGVMKGFGFHDVVIESPVHEVGLKDLEEREVGDVVLAYRKRILQLSDVASSIKYVQVFKNHGASAGASMSHSHSQMIALPIVPPNVCTRLEAMKQYFNQNGKCILCEAPPKELLVDESTHFISMVPFAASFAFEIWIVPRDHSSHFHHIDDEKAVDLGGLLKLMLRKMSVQLNDPPYNFMIHTSPLEITESELPCCHWFLQIVPQLAVFGGFEVGSGCYINSVFPEDAAEVLRQVNVCR